MEYILFFFDFPFLFLALRIPKLEVFSHNSYILLSRYFSVPLPDNRRTWVGVQYVVLYRIRVSFGGSLNFVSYIHCAAH